MPIKFLDLPEVVIVDVFRMVSSQDLAVLSAGNKTLLDAVLEHTPAISLRSNGTSSRSPLGPFAQNRLPHAVQAAQRKSQSTLKLCCGFWAKPQLTKQSLLH
jgi:hypothetical protein